RVSRELKRLEIEGFERVEQAKVGRRFDRNRVAGLRNGFQREGQGLGAATGDRNILRREGLAPTQGAAGNLLTQPRIAFGNRIDVVLYALHPRGPCQETIEPSRSQE